jgi:tripartite-type tricarboxylate transporter receptor subunit TctC
MNEPQRLRRRIVLGAASLPIAALANAQGSAGKPIRLVVPFPPGGIVDIVARILQGALQDTLGQTIVIDNKPGASGSIGTAEVARAAPDGNTLLMVFDTHATNHLLVKNISYDPFNSFSSIALLATSSAVLVTGNQFAGKSAKELIGAAKTKSNGYFFGTVGAGSSNHLTAALFAQQAGFMMTPVPYKGGGPLITDLMGGQVDAAFTSLAISIAHVRGNKLKLIAVSSARRLQEFPDVQTVAETLPGFEATAWVAFVAPKGLPDEVAAKLNKAANKVLADPVIRRRLEEQGLTAAGGTPQDFDRMLRTEAVRWGRVIRELKVEAS